MADQDMAWLLRHIPRQDTLGLETSKAQAICSIIEDLDRSAMPATIGLFGTWGSGKTTTLAYLVRRFLGSGKSKAFNVIYFNAWKYAGFTEVVPAMIFKVLTSLGEDKKASSAQVVGRVMLSLGQRYAEAFGAWTKTLTGADLVKVAKEALDIEKLVKDAAHPLDALAREYYTQIDRSQDLLAGALRKSSRVLVALIDELDRCDPGEAFEIVKQLRVFFTMREVPVVFVLSVNPDPIGQAIKHQFGLESEWGDYEARKILEKFVDHYVDMEDSGSIVEYVRAVWKAAGLDLDQTCLIARVDAQLRLPDYHTDTIRHASFNESMLADNPVYMNRRLLAKCLQRMQTRGGLSPLTLTVWHLEVAEQAYPALRRSMALLADDLVRISKKAHEGLIRELVRSGCLEANGRVVDGGTLESDKGGAAFAVYRSFFWEEARERLGELGQKGDERAQLRKGALQRLLEEYRKVDFVATALMQPLRQLRLQGDSVHQWDFQEAHLGWLLSNY